MSANRTRFVDSDTLDVADLLNQRRTDTSGQYRLALAVFERGVADLGLAIGAREACGAAVAARAWVERRGGDGLYTFSSLCLLLDFDEDWWRRELLNPDATIGRIPGRNAGNQVRPREATISTKGPGCFG